MNTNIYLSRKLETFVSKSLMNSGDKEIDHPLGKWTATLFYVTHKKCLLITNSVTRYTVILDSVISSNFFFLSELFARTFYDQLVIDTIKIDWLDIQKLVGKVNIFSTDNDRHLIGVQNNILQIFEYWKRYYGQIDNWPFREINSRINELPFNDQGWFIPKEKMKIKLDSLIINA